MSNMSYCRWENTYEDLLDCIESIGEVETKELSKTEQKFKEKVLELCYENANLYEEMIDKQSNEEKNEEE